ncbi:5-dehydro-2-deoxygluconokinase [Nocardiopsis sp. FIRDI 009]|uniref:5-dehydro-2-deoxygluconokinase n=1 Tax=Nocardiopsis sp. FIRDI 009 TaxID=714197 RepID=UPI000E24C9B7|nr:5-dehydro-2-deoxygluconokinase [Nocardiopsis sp. FIRDI 009]
MGRVGVDVYPEQTGVGLDAVSSFGKFLGGSPTNVAVAAARHGHRSAVITRTGDDPFGRFVHRALRGFGVDDRFVTPVADLPTPVTFCEIFPPDDFPLYFYGRDPVAPDLMIRAEDLDLDAIATADVFWVTVTGLSREPSRTATLEALRARGRRGITVIDLDYRPMFWESRAEARRWVAEALPYATVAAGNLDEWETAVGDRDPQAAAKAGRAAGIDLAVVKRGPAGVLAVDDSGQVSVAPVPVEVVNGLGAGDAFGGALCHGLLSGWDTERVMRFANAAGAIVASRLSCSDAMPTSAEVEATLEEAAHAG